MSNNAGNVNDPNTAYHSQDTAFPFKISTTCAAVFGSLAVSLFLAWLQTESVPHCQRLLAAEGGHPGVPLFGGAAGKVEFPARQLL